MNNHRFEDRFGNNNLPHLLQKALMSSQTRESEARVREQQAKLEVDIDPLTGVLNRGGLDKLLVETIKRLSHEGGQIESDPDYLLFFFADIDRFKFLNDTHGHIQGDEALKIVARRFEHEAKERGGVVARYAGDEFVAVQVGKGHLTDTIEAISSRIQGKLNSNLSLSVGGSEFKITVSVGCVVLTGEELQSGGKQTPEEMAIKLIEKADAAMYAHKRSSVLERRE